MTAAAPGSSEDRLPPIVRAKRDLAVAIVLALVMVVMLYTTRTIPNSAYEPMGPRFLAILVPGLILLLSLMLALRSLVTLRKAQSELPGQHSPVTPHRWQRPFIVLLLLAAYGTLLQLNISYVPATACFIMAAAFVLDIREMSPGRRVRANTQIIAVAWLVAFIVHRVFVDALSVLLP